MIVILGCSEVDKEISSAGMETVKSNDCREVSEDNEDANRMLVTMQEKARFSYKDRQNFINLFI